MAHTEEILVDLNLADTVHASVDLGDLIDLREMEANCEIIIIP
jgi:hypothetical protein